MLRLVLGIYGLVFWGLDVCAEEKGLPPVRAITKGPKFHWFGYYDHLQFDPKSRYALGMEVDFEHRSPRPDGGTPETPGSPPATASSPRTATRSRPPPPTGAAAKVPTA